MPDAPINSVFEFTPRFLRSTNLERDFRAPQALDNYVLTDHSRQCLERLAEGLQSGATARAWRITGDYGSGKSSFALMLAHWVSGGTKQLKGELRAALAYDRFRLPASPRYLPVLVTGSREPMGRAILRSLVRTMDDVYTRGERSALVAQIAQATESGGRIADNDTVRWLAAANAKLIKDGKAKGLLLLLDELGKFLEYAAYNPQQQDVFLLQRLAEASSGSANHPLFVVGLLHQGFNVYADNLGPAVQREWDKIAGRFDEIVFNQPLVQTAELVGAALRVRRTGVPAATQGAVRQAMDEVRALGWFGSPRLALPADLATRLFPLHPSVLPVLIRCFHRFAQNERSLFSFLLSSEPFGLQDFSQGPLVGGQLYRLPDLYDYLRANLGHRLALQGYRSHWAEIDSMVESFTGTDEVELQILKAVGILNLLDHVDLLPTEEALHAALGGPKGIERRVLQAKIQHLHQNRRVLFRRGSSRSFCLWSHTSVDLQASYERAVQAVGQVRRVGPQLGEILARHPIVARRHYIQTGNLRYFDVHYCPVDEIESLAAQQTEADGLVLVALCESPAECDRAGELARSRALANARQTLVAVPEDPLSNHAGLVAEVLRWNWVAQNTPELTGDRSARDEVTRQRKEAEDRLRRRIEDLLGLNSLSGTLALRWFHGGKPCAIATPREFLAQLSTVADGMYPDAPHVANELINRRELSSAASAARMRLIERIFSEGDRELLGMAADKKPPERSIYLSILVKGGLHQRRGDSWALSAPPDNDPCHLRPVFRFLREQVEQAGDARLKVSELFAAMGRPPFGVRGGLAPLLLAVHVAIHPEEFAFYEENTFLPRVGGEEFMRMAKEPQTFELQLCKVSGLRADVFTSLLEILQLAPTGAKQRQHVLQVVKPLCLFVAKLPDYARNTARLSTAARQSRQAILAARDPGKLIFHDLPAASGLDPFPAGASPKRAAVKNYADRLRQVIAELDSAYAVMLQRMADRLKENFGLAPSLTLTELRSQLATRTEPLLVQSSEPKLKALCLRFGDRALNDDKWLEALGGAVALTPPPRWQDADEDTFGREIVSLAEKFKHMESIHFAQRGRTGYAEAFRLALTRDNGDEAQEVVFVDQAELARVNELAGQMQSMLAKNRRLGMAALSKVVWHQLRGK